MQTLSVWVGANIIYLYGTVNGLEATFTLVREGVWETTVPRAEDDRYIIFLQAYSTNGLEYEGTRIIQLYDGWVEPKTNWTHEDYENWEDFNRQKHTIKYVATELLVKLGLNPNFEDIEDVDISSYPRISTIAKLESNIVAIKDSITFVYDWFQLPEWKDEVFWSESGAAPDYRDINRWENNMFLIKEWAEPIFKRFKVSGTFSAGQANILPRRVI